MPDCILVNVYRLASILKLFLVGGNRSNFVYVFDICMIINCRKFETGRQKYGMKGK